ncbi:MAG: NADH-dependent [FeFe] hydrogenase, group A6 [Candidatus Margulisiibacteriota bacterium]
MADKTINLLINNKPVEVQAGATILDAAKIAGVHIPTLCHHDDLCVAGICRICVVEVENYPTLQASCATPAAEGMNVKTHTQKVRKARRNVLELMLADHYGECYSCLRNQNCELQKLAEEYGIDEYYFGHKTERKWTPDYSSYAVIRDKDKCISCKRCIRTCQGLQGIGIFEQVFKGHEATVDTFWDHAMRETICINCGQCINRCPTAALREKNETDKVWEAIDDPTKHVILQTAPSPRAAIAEEFGVAPGTSVTKELNTAAKNIGFDKVFDTNFTADLTILEEGTELLMRLKKALTGENVIENAALPMITSCSPGWVKFCEHYFPEQLDHLSTCKSPQQMFGAILKTYYADKAGIDPKDIVTVALMPCTAKKFECNRPEMTDSGHKDIDVGLTTREMAQMIKEAGLNVTQCEKSEFDDPVGLGSGAGIIFGATGGVMEAALRTAYEIVTGREVPFKDLDITPVRGMEGIREAEIKLENVNEEWKFLEGVTAKVAIANGTANARIIMDQVKAGTAPWHFIEIMACPGGCLGGGGQPIPTSPEIRKARAKAIYAEDHNMPIRKSHDNPQVQTLYKEFLEKPLGHNSHKLLHTTYTPRGKKMVEKDRCL